MKDLERELAIYSGKIIRELRKSKNYTQKELGDKIGVSNSAVANYEKGYRAPLQDTLFNLANEFNVSIDYFFPNNNEIEYVKDINVVYNKLEQPRKVKVYNFATEQLEEQNNVIDINDYLEEDLYGYASAGTGQQVYDNPVETIRLHKSDIPTQHYDLILQVVGDSMEPAFKDGEYIFIRKTDSLRNGQFGVFIIDGESYLKKVYVEDDHLRLVSLNDKYEDLIFTEDDGITLVGQVVL